MTEQLLAAGDSECLLDTRHFWRIDTPLENHVFFRELQQRPLPNIFLLEDPRQLEQQIRKVLATQPVATDLDPMTPLREAIRVDLNEFLGPAPIADATGSD